MEKPTKLPAEGYVRLSQILAVLPISRSEWYRRVESGQYPKPTRLGKRIVGWQVEDVRRILAELSHQLG